MVCSVPQGGNWKNIPESIPSKRLDQIRASFARGEGSRSTYYGRLRVDAPSYTINTYFNRPGNGCHIHPTQDRVISQREAARFQSFPDNFEFLGSQGAICTQIGNAVPPMLAYSVASTLGSPGAFIDLFSGAGGMGLGFKWANWTPVFANDIEPTFLQTYSRNIHSETIPGSIADPIVFEKMVEAALSARKIHKKLWVLGGPPCQGFSTAGNKRSMEDERNQLFWNYVHFLEQVKPDGFVFENVTGLLNMQGGDVFSAVKKAFSTVMPNVYGAVLSSDDYGIPQRRKRVFLVGLHEKSAPSWTPPAQLTTTSANPDDLLLSEIQPAISVHEAIADLPKLGPGEDGSCKPYRTKPTTIYQALMRGSISVSEYYSLLQSGTRAFIS